MRSVTIFSNILISSEDKFTKIYTGNSDKIYDSIQDYFNYMPHEKEELEVVYFTGSDWRDNIQGYNPSARII